MTAATTTPTAVAHSRTAMSMPRAVWRRRRLLTKMRGALRDAGAEAGRRRAREPRKPVLNGLRRAVSDRGGAAWI